MGRSISGLILQAKIETYTGNSVWPITHEILVRSLYDLETKPTRTCRENSRRTREQHGRQPQRLRPNQGPRPLGGGTSALDVGKLTFIFNFYVVSIAAGGHVFLKTQPSTDNSYLLVSCNMFIQTIKI